MIVVTVFLLIMNWIKYHLIHNQKENHRHHDHIPFNLKGNGIIVFSMQTVEIICTAVQETSVSRHHVALLEDPPLHPLKPQEYHGTVEGLINPLIRPPLCREARDFPAVLFYLQSDLTSSSFKKKSASFKKKIVLSAFTSGVNTETSISESCLKWNKFG